MDSSWSAEAAAVLERACAHHGGLRTWQALRRVRLVPVSLAGLLPWAKGLGRTFPLPSRIEIAPHERRTTFEGYPDEAHVGVFQDGDVRIASRRDGRVVDASVNHRATFRGLSKNRRWSPLDALYFFGYAMWHYHSLPFTLGDGRLIRLRTAGTAGAPLHALEIELPEDVPTHSRQQTFHFDGAGQLVRHDYRAEVVGSWAHGAHSWSDYRAVGGLLIAMKRHVVPLLGATPFPATVLRAQFADAEVDLDSE